MSTNARRPSSVHTGDSPSFDRYEPPRTRSADAIADRGALEDERARDVWSRHRSAAVLIIISESNELVMNHHPRVLWMNTQLDEAHHRPRILSFVVFPPALRRTPEDPA
jgi:hypothetical protein